MKIFSIVFTILFFASAAVQFNDPDPEFWVALYGVCGFISLFAIFKKYNPWVILLVLAVSAFEAFKLAPGFWTWLSSGAPSIVESMQAESPYIEGVREFLGLMICIVVLIFYYIRCRKPYMHSRNSDSN